MSTFTTKMRQQVAGLQPVRPITNGIQLIGQLAGIHANVGPNALLRSASYPLPGSGSSPAGSPLTAVPLPAGFGYWRIDSGSSQFTMPSLWTSPTAAYAYSNEASNLGGIVPSGGLMVDGYLIPAGTYVFQFMDFSLGTIDMLSSGPLSVLFRGCRNRIATGGSSEGFLNTGAYTGNLYVHYCDIGGPDATTAGYAEYGITANGQPAVRVLRCYFSYLADAISGNGLQHNDYLENYIEKISLYPDAAANHLDGFQMNGGGPLSALIQRNHIVIASTDDAGNFINQTGCISLFEDFGTYPGTGTNSDGSTGYWVTGNYVGGVGYCFYLAAGNGTYPPISNLHFEDNLVTTQVFGNGGYYGPAAYIPSWGTGGNEQAGNVWADGITAGASVLTPETQYQYTSAESASTVTLSIATSAGNTVTAYIAAYINSDTPLHLTGVSDSAGNTWAFSNAAASQSPPANGCYDTSEHYYGFSAIAYCLAAPHAITTLTITMNQVCDFIGLGAAELALSPGAFADGAASAGTLLTGVTGFTTPSVTTTQPNDVIVTTCSCDTGWLDVTSPPRFYVENGPGIVNVADGVVFAPGTYAVTFAGAPAQDVQGVCILALAVGS